MVTVWSVSGLLRRIVDYNEQKLKTGEALCIYARNFIKDADQITAAEKRQRFAAINELSPAARSVGVHIRLQFSPEDQLDHAKMIDIAREFMKRIGYDRQPYLVYRHLDAFFPHLHIVSTLLRSDGSWISLLHLGRTQGERISQSIESDFSLTKDIGNRRAEQHLPGQKIQYGERLSSQAINDTLNYVLHNYQYRSIEELNAILSLYNVVAKTGVPGGRMHQHRGLIYLITDDEGKTKGAPISASRLESKPTLDWLEQHIAATPQLPQESIDRTRLAVDYVVRHHPKDREKFADLLREEGVYAKPVFDKKGDVQGLFFIDMTAKTALNATALGQDYQAAAIHQRLGFEAFSKHKKSNEQDPSQEQAQKQTRRRGRHL